MPQQLTIPIIDPLGIISTLQSSFFPAAPFRFVDVFGMLRARSSSSNDVQVHSGKTRTAENAETWELVTSKRGELQGIVIHREIKY